MVIIHDMKQYTDEWWAVRMGIPTSSSADKILTPTGRLSKRSGKYIDTLLAERAGFADEPEDPTEWMVRGLQKEPDARLFYEFDQGVTVDQVGFITNDDGTAGCSPDGLINGDCGWEVKCPKPSTHIGYLRRGEMPPYYKPQVHMSMAITGLKKWVFMSYYPGLDPLIVPVKWDAYTDEIAAALTEFIALLESESGRMGITDWRKAA